MLTQSDIVEPTNPMRRLFTYLGRYRGRLSFSVSSSVANKVLDLMPPLLVGWVIDTVSKRPPAWIQSLMGDADSLTMALFIASLGVLIFAFESLFQWMYQYGFMTLAQQAQHDLRMDTYDSLQRREIAFFEDHRMGETMSVLSDDVNQLERFLNTGLNEVVQLLTLFVFAGWVLFDTSWELALYGMGSIPVIVIGSLFYQRLIAPRYLKVRQAVGRLLSRLENNIAGIHVVKSFTAEKFELARVAEESEAYRRANHNAIKLSSVYIPLIRMAIAISFGLVLYIGADWVLSDATYADGTRKLTAGDLVLFAMMIQRLLWPLTRLGETLDNYERARASCRRVFGMLDTPSRIPEPANPIPLGRAKGRITFDQVRFRYARGDDILRGLTLDIAAGQTVGIAGTTGAGKSTLVKLLLRLYDVTEGAVRIDGHNVRELTLADLRRNIALVSQDVYLFHGTIAENIGYGIDGISRQAVEDAARVAHLHEFVEELSEGYDTIVGEHGIKLSGGQRQRLSIARAILKDAPVMIFDEATSSVDTETEREIQLNLRKFTQGKTALVIAHRLSTIRHADRIIVLRDGIVAEDATHDELVARGGVYADLWAIQSGEAAHH